nr:YraN family protein [Mergibacter septicus]
MMRNKFNTTQQGAIFEQKARQYLEQQGLRFIAANQRFKKGELDLIMQEKQTLVFVEVRQRKHQHYGSAIESVTYNKQQRLINTANQWLAQHQLSLETIDCRFDLITFDGNQHQLHWWKNFIEINN